MSSALEAPLPPGRSCRSASSAAARDHLLAPVCRVAHAGVFERLQELLLDELGQAGALDWSRVSLDSFSQRATRGDQVGANPVDRAKPGFKLHLAVEGGGLPLSLLVTRANTNDSLMFEALLDDIPAVRTPAGQRRRRPQKVHARQGLRPSPLPRLSHPPRHQGPHRCEIESSDRLGRHRWKADARSPGCRLPAATHPLRPGPRAVLRLRAARWRPAVLQPAALRSHRPITMIPVPECPLTTNPIAAPAWMPSNQGVGLCHRTRGG
jgi:hypothetical protein